MNCIMRNGLFQRLAPAALAIALMAALACAILWNAARAPEASAHGEHPHSPNSSIESCEASPPNPRAGENVTLRATVAHALRGANDWGLKGLGDVLTGNPANAVDANADMYVVFKFYRNGREVGRLGGPRDIRRFYPGYSQTFTQRAEARAPRLPAGVVTEVVCSLVQRYISSSGETTYVERDHTGGTGQRRNAVIRVRGASPSPADDHGDDRSSATRISGSGAVGGIGTADDLDFFSFQARRGMEYAIETSIFGSLDTVITLYSSGGSRLGSDDNGGAGRASKLVWTAPSSAVYYVRVSGSGSSTGTYMLTLASRAPSPPPAARLSSPSVPSSATVGRSFDVRVELRNDGGDGERGGVSVSFPTLSGGSKSSGNYSSSRADVRVVSYTGGTGRVSIYKTGDSLNHSNGATMSARHLLIESDDPTWRSEASRALTLRVTPKSAGEFPIRIRGWICADRYSSCSRSPSSGSSDQQGYRATVRTVVAAAPAPADDHGDDRSSATRISVGSGASGVIGTAGDLDYFSFQARSGGEYTIETRVSSGSRVDTIIGLYSAAGALLGGDDNGGGGRASKLAWTAPSSGAYYVLVMGGSDSTGGYRLSVSERAPSPAGKLQTAPIGGLTAYFYLNENNEPAGIGVWSANYTLTNRVPNGEAIRWEASSDRNWLTVSPSSGSLRGGESATVSVAISERGSLNLPTGTHTATVAFSNRTNGVGDSTRTASFHRLDANIDPIDAEPVETLRLTGARSEAYRAAGLEEAWRQMASMSERGLLNPVDITVIDTNLWRPPTGSSGNEGMVLSEFDWNSINADHISGATELRDSAHGYGVASIIAAVNHAKNAAPSASSFSGVVSSVPGLEYHIDFHPVGVLNFSGAMDRPDPIYLALAIAAAAASSPDVVNISLGNPCASWLEDVCTAVQGGGVIDDAQDTIFVIAAGNNGGDARGTWPANIDSNNVITVAATDPSGNKRGFWDNKSSNHGPKIDIAAPSGIHAVNPNPHSTSAYNPFEGTSSAAPLVSGVVAMLRAIDPDITALDVNELLRRTGNPITVCVADGDLPLAQCPAGKTEDWIVMNAGAAVKHLMRHRGIPLAPAYAPTPAPAAPAPAPTAAENGPIAFVSDRDGDYQIYAMNADGSGVARLTNNSAFDWGPSWSPDGRRIAFSSDRSGNFEIYAMNADGSGVARLTDDSGGDFAPSWSPDGRRIAFSSTRSGNSEIYAMNADGSGVARLTNRPNNSDRRPEWSPDGGWIAFQSSHGDNNDEIYVMNADGSGVTRLTNNSTHDSNPSWSPDGRRIAFESDRSGNFEIYAMNADGSGLARLTNNSTYDGRLSWSPDGRRIAFSSNRSGNTEIYAMDADGSGVARLTNSSSADWAPSWGPASARAGGAPPSAADDHGDSRSRATRVSVGSSASGVIGTASDADYFSFQAQRGGEYTIETSIASGSRVDTVITLYAANGSRLGGNDDGGSGRASKMVWTAPSSATYYVKVEGHGGTTGGYRLSVTERERTPAPPADDHGDSRSRATSAIVNSGVSGVIGTASDSDYFSFHAAPSGEYTIETSIASGSDVDTAITLYDTNGSRLEENDDDGSGRASKIVWTAPSSGIYYVKVEGRGGTTGGYQLSVSERAAPVANISEIFVPNNATVGQSFDIYVKLVNGGVGGGVGGVSVSFPTLTGGSKSSGRYTSSAADIQTVNPTAWEDVSMYKSGDRVHASTGRAFSAEHLLIEASDGAWSWSLARPLMLRVTPKREGNFPIMVRGWICADMYSDCSRAPSSGSSDQQGYRALSYTVNVVAPTPADDHGDSRSRATRVTVGSGASGVIGTANDADYFSFQAQRGGEYTIETSISSGSRVDTVITLYAANGSRLEGNDDGGVGRASKIVWTATSSATYYVKVEGHGGTTGGYRLSVTERERTPAPAPDAELAVMSLPRSTEAGRSFVFRTDLRNTGGAGEHGGVSVSFPTLTDGGATSRGYSSAQADIEVVSYGGAGGVGFYDSGDTVNRANGSTMRARHLLVETDEPAWTSSSGWSELTLRITPKRAGAFPIMVRGWICADMYSDCSRAPSSGSSDQQGYRALSYTVNVVASTPADDHGDSRSRATRVSVGSSASGVIGTSSDADYFSFQARRGGEYTIETSIASGSRVDTAITLYAANGSRLGGNDDGGSGRASKIVWSAPSSATYYVKVEGHGGTTGGYRLSVTERAPAPAPVARVSTTGVPNAATVGQSFDISFELRNDGGDGERGGVSVSFPTLSGGSKTSGNYSSSRADVRVVSYTGGTGNVSLYKTGDSLIHSNGSAMSARHLLIESNDPTWPASTTRRLTLRVTPKSAGNFPIRVGGWICANGYSDCSMSPSSGSEVDQQGYRTYLETVRVAAATPADDHGDSRSRATRVTVGSGVSGVIGTASDLDYFSFQARRGGEYTIETSVASGSRVDTLIGLFNANDSLLSHDNDSGSGRASKIVWTAPSSAVYYVLVMGDNDSTGGYRLSVTERERTPAPAPQAELAVMSLPRSTEAGRSFVFRTDLRNTGGAGEHGGVSVSFPTLTDGGATSRGYSSAQADIEVVSYGGAGGVGFYDSGDTVNRANGSTMRARHLLVETDEPAWAASSGWSELTLRITPKRAGAFPIMVRGWICADGYSDCSRDPSSGSSDQQGYRARVETVNVVATAPADDHGNDRSSSTAISADSRTGGNIETSGDADFFSFQARRGAEYTIETRVRSGLDTVITLYAANGSRLGEDDDGGDGAASKLTWTAPSSAACYIKVAGYSASETGAYELSLSETPPPAPATGSVSFTLTRSSPPSHVEVGESFEIAGRIHGVSGGGERGGISISFPSLTGGRAYADSYESSAADVREVRSNGMSVFTYAEGDAIDNPALPETTARYLLFESDGIRWSSSTDRTLRLRVTPKRAGEFPILIRAWVCADRYSQCARSPRDGVRDQQGMKAMSVSVTVVDPPAPTPEPPPADDHGDDRSSATGISVGSSASGVIGTTSDVDFFSFQARRGAEYTIETSIASGSGVDTLITLYPANGSALLSDNDRGRGVASKIEWTAPSSAAYYVAVMGDDDTTGGYRLSLTESAPPPVPTPAPAPRANVAITAGFDDVEVGQSYEFNVELRNDGGAGNRGGITISFPSLVGGSKSSGRYESSAADIQIANPRNWDDVSMYKSGDRIYASTGRAFSAEHLMVEASDDSWPSSLSYRTLALRVTPKRAGEFRVLVRGWICAEDCSLSPVSGSSWPSDQQGHKAADITINVVAPTPTPAPASGAGGRIAFTSHRDGNGEIYAMNADGSGVVRLTTGSAGLPAWSPDGRRIAFESRKDGNWEIYTMNADGSGVVRLTDNSYGDGHPSWSPDGRRIAFESDRDGNSRIYVMNADGSGVARVTNGSGHDRDPSWSPSGRIAFSSDRDGNNEIYAINVDGSGLARLTNNSAYDGVPSWSPDGRRIAFASHRDGNGEIYAMNADGSGLARLTRNDSADDWYPSWSPDGRRIVFHAGRGENRELYAVNADGSGRARLTSNSVHDSTPAWGP